MRILVVEDEVFIAMEIESVVGDAGHTCVGIAGDSTAARALARDAEIALVDLNLRDGATGQALGVSLAEDYGLTVIFMTADAQDIAENIRGPLGVLPKPVSEPELRQLIDYVSARTVARADRRAVPGGIMPPARLTLFHRAA